MHELDIRLRLLAGTPWEVEGVGTIYPPTLREIIEVGYTTYLGYINLMTLEPKDFITDESLAKQVVGFDLLCSDEIEKEVINSYLTALKFFFREEEAYFSQVHMAVFLGYLNKDVPRIINRDNYNKIKDIINLLNFSSEVNETSFNPAGEKARQIVEKLKKRKEILRKQKKAKRDGDSEGIDIDLSDIISSVSAKSGDINVVLDYTFYQLMDAYKRLEHINDYDITIMAMMQAGGDKLKLNHWAGKIVDADE